MTKEERLDRLEQENKLLRQKLEELQPKQRDSVAVAFRKEVMNWARDKTDEIPVKWTVLHDSANTVIKVKLGLKNIVNMTDDQVPEARKAFELYQSIL